MALRGDRRENTETTENAENGGIAENKEGAGNRKNLANAENTEGAGNRKTAENKEGAENRKNLANAKNSEGGERGAATILVLAALGVVLVLLVAGLALGSAVLATHRARAAADLGALAAAGALQQGAGWPAACASGASVSARNGARPTGCVVQVDGSVTFTATTSPSFILPGTSPDTTTATARAGPSP